MIERYFDNAATTPVDPRVADAMAPFGSERFGNANSVHSWGSNARSAVEVARERVALLLGADDPSEVIFTAGATESNNWLLSNFARIAISPFEHSSVREPAIHLGAEILKNRAYSLSPPETNPELLSVMLVNNETGALLDPPPHSSLLHRDLTQAAGKVPISLAGVDFASLSAHKLYGPKGIGALYIRSGRFIEPLLRGGEHEQGLRAGTLNVPAIVGFGEAARIAGAEIDADFDRTSAMREVIVGEAFAVGQPEPTRFSPYILSLSFPDIHGETLAIELDQLGFAVSSGAACSARSTEPSHVLQALGLPESNIRGTIRVSMGRFNTLESARALGRAISRSVEKLRQLHG